MDHTIEPYYSVAKDVQQQRVADHMVPGSETGKPLLDYCHENALVLARSLAEQGYTPRLVWGAIVDPHETIAQHDTDFSTYTVEDCEHDGLVHFWVEITDGNPKPIVCEIACETELDESVSRGEAIAVRGRPDNYYVPPNALIRYDDVLTHDDLLSLEHYYDLLNRGFIIED